MAGAGTAIAVTGCDRDYRKRGAAAFGNFECTICHSRLFLRFTDLFFSIDRLAPLP